MELIRKLIFILMTCEILTFGATSYSQKEYKRDIGKLDGGIEGITLGIEDGYYILKLYRDGSKEPFQSLVMIDENDIKYIKKGNGIRWQDFDHDGISELCITHWRAKKNYTYEFIYKWYGEDEGFDYFYIINEKDINFYIPEYDVFWHTDGKYWSAWETISRWDGQKFNLIRWIDYKYNKDEDAWHYRVTNYDTEEEVLSEYTRTLYYIDYEIHDTMVDKMLYEGLP